jgi:hypothetical protein
VTRQEQGEFALCLVGMLLGLAALVSPAPLGLVLAAPGFVLTSTMLVRLVRRARVQ